ncbi:ribosomal protein S5 domain 2-like protein [Atractiella rhizophila]|nr:ribosomal protein S5 domain 2-like protein [Atractiella rhizophila]
MDAEVEASLAASTLKRLDPRRYLSYFVRSGVRPDGRTFEEFRECSTNNNSITTAKSSCLVRKGDTTKWESEIGRENVGWIVPNVDLPAMSSSRFRPGPPSEEAQILSHRLKTLLLSPPIVPLESLVIEKGKLCWVLYIDVLCINYDGNVWDAIVESVWSSLRTLRLPKAIYDQDTLSAAHDPSAPPTLIDLTISNLSSSTFSVFSDTSSNPPIPPTLLSDPTDFEAQLCPTTLNVVYSVDKKGRKRLRHVFQSGKAGEEVLTKCMEVSKRRLDAMDLT